MANIKLRHMSASVQTNVTCEVMIKATGEVIELENVTVLTSWYSNVAVYDGKRVYLLPRYGFSNSTWKHVHAFISDYCDKVPHLYAKEMREVAALVSDTTPYIFASGISYGGGNFKPW